MWESAALWDDVINPRDYGMTYTSIEWSFGSDVVSHDNVLFSFNAASTVHYAEPVSGTGNQDYPWHLRKGTFAATTALRPREINAFSELIGSVDLKTFKGGCKGCELPLPTHCSVS